MHVSVKSCVLSVMCAVSHVCYQSCMLSVMCVVSQVCYHTYAISHVCCQSRVLSHICCQSCVQLAMYVVSQVCCQSHMLSVMYVARTTKETKAALSQRSLSGPYSVLVTSFYEDLGALGFGQPMGPHLTLMVFQSHPSQCSHILWH